MTDEILRVRGLRKTFPGVVALAGIDFDLRPGERLRPASMVPVRLATRENAFRFATD